MPETTAGVPRNATRVRLELPEIADHVVKSALESAIRHAIGDQAAVVDWYHVGEDGAVITVTQEHASWWTMMPSAFFEQIGGYFGTSVLRWRDDKPPEAPEW